MATVARRKTGALTELVLKQHDSVNVYQLMRLLLIGQDPSWPIDKRLRFRADLSAAFPAHEFSKVTLRKNTSPNLAHSDAANDGSTSKNASNGQVIDISTANYCISSILGPLPEPFTEWVRDLERARNPAMADFLNIFNQRLNVLRYKLKAANTIGLNSVPPAETGQAHALAALMGLGQPKLANQVPLPPRAWLGMAGLLSNTRKCASTVTQVLALFLQDSCAGTAPANRSNVQTKVTLKPLVGAWQQIEQEDRIALGHKNQTLGRRSVIGKRVWDQQARVKLCIGPISYQRLCQLLPPNRTEQRAASHADHNIASGKATPFQSFIGLLQLLLDGLVDCEIEFDIDSASIPATRSLAYSMDGKKTGMRLGQTAWLHDSISPQPRKNSLRRVSYLVHAHDSPAQAEMK